MRQLKNIGMAKEGNPANNGARRMEFRSFDDRDDGEHTSVGFVEIANIYPMQIIFFFVMASFDEVYDDQWVGYCGEG